MTERKWYCISNSNLCNTLQGWPPLPTTAMMSAYVTTATTSTTTTGSNPINFLLHLWKDSKNTTTKDKSNGTHKTMTIAWKVRVISQFWNPVFFHHIWILFLDLIHWQKTRYCWTKILIDNLCVWLSFWWKAHTCTLSPVNACKQSIWSFHVIKIFK